MRLKKFDKTRKEKILKNKLYKDDSIKQRTLVLAVCILFLSILFFSYSKYESSQSYTIVNGKVGTFYKKIYAKDVSTNTSGVSLQDAIDELAAAFN